MNTENPAHMLAHEHRYILKVVNAMRAIDEKLAAGNGIDPDLIGKIVYFMREFADQCHHAKEEAVLFPAMVDKGVPEKGCPIGALKAEHVKGRQLVTNLEKAGRDYARGDTGAGDKVREILSEITRLYPDHIWKEDEMVFPMVERLFDDTELDALNTDFEKAEEEFGRNHEYFVAFANEMEQSFGKGSE